MNQTLIATFTGLFAVPLIAVPYLDLMFAESDVQLVVAAAGGPFDRAAAMVALEEGGEETDLALDGAYRRAVLDREGEGPGAVYTTTSFYTRMDYFATFDDWHSIPAQVRSALDEWMLGCYAADVGPNVERLRAGLPPERSPGKDSILLLGELDAVVDAATTIAVFPCNCRKIAGHCARPLEVCLHFGAAAEKKLARGHGRRLSHAQAKALLRFADREGLMHTTDLHGSDDGPAPICNCCGDDCYVFRTATRLGTKDVWPRRRFQAVHDPEVCNRCGVCVRRCHFGAFSVIGGEMTQDGSGRQPVIFDAARCWGCGLCANSCRAGAITMLPLALVNR